MAQRKALGKGLEALLGDVTPTGGESVQQIAIGLLDPNRAQARKQFDEEKLNELAESIAASGLIQPLIVSKQGERYKIVAGERRFRAARIAGLKTLPVLVRDYDDQQLMEVSLIENLQRENLNPVEEAAGIKLLMEQHDLTQEEVSKRLGKSRSAVANSVRLLSLPESVLDLLREGKLTAGHARVLVPIESQAEQIKLANDMVQQSMPVRAAEKLAKSPRKSTTKPAQSPELYQMTDELRSHFGTKVIIDGDIERGKIIIEYYAPDELDRLYELLLESRMLFGDD